VKLSILFISCLLFTLPLFGKIRLKIDIIDTIGGDKGLVLVSEMHSIEIVEDRRKVKLEMKSGISVDFLTYYIFDMADYGPSPKVRIVVKIYQDSKLIKSYEENGGEIIELGTPARFIFNNSDRQLLEITVVPESL
jgi:hypothetical protein